MADINHTISLGIGSPAAIPEFITFGLQIGEALEAYDTAASILFTPEDKNILYTGDSVTTLITKEDKTTMYA